MLWFLCKILFVSFFSMNLLAEQFSSKDCLQENFSTTISHEGEFWGLLKNKLEVEKKNCTLKIFYKRILETKWEIDVCREPIHMKLRQNGKLSVLKRVRECKGNESEYCEALIELKENVHDFGLIFAKGERESLKTSHGQVYCTSLLLDKYLHKGNVLSKYDTDVELFEKSDKEKCELPTTKKENDLSIKSNQEIMEQKVNPVFEVEKSEASF